MLCAWVPIRQGFQQEWEGRGSDAAAGWGTVGNLDLWGALLSGVCQPHCPLPQTLLPVLCSLFPHHPDPVGTW